MPLQPLQIPEYFSGLKAVRRQHHQKLVVGKIQKVRQPEMAFALLDSFLGRGHVGVAHAALATRQELAKTSVSRAIARIGQNVRRAVLEDESRADHKPGFMRQIPVVQFLVGAHHAGQRVAIGDSDHRQAQRAGLMHIFLRMRAAAQEREVGRDADFRKGRLVPGGAHANSPCRNHCG